MQDIFKGNEGAELSSFLFKNWSNSHSKKLLSKDNLLISTENMLVFNNYNNSITVGKPNEHPDKHVLYIGTAFRTPNPRTVQGQFVLLPGEVRPRDHQEVRGLRDLPAGRGQGGPPGPLLAADGERGLQGRLTRS